MLATHGGWARPLALVGSGGIGTLAIQHVVPMAWHTGWLPVAVTGLLSVAAIAILSIEAVRRRGLQADVPAVAAFVDLGSGTWDQAPKAVDWLDGCGALAIPYHGLEGFLRSELRGALAPLPDAGSDGGGPVLPLPLSLLALSFALRSGSREDATLSRTIMRSLGQAHGLPDPVERARALMALGEGIPRHARDGGAGDAIRHQASSHGTVASYLLGLLAHARRNGAVLAPGEFLWLKGVDRGLWYALDGLGRTTFHVEGLAAMDHYRHEIEVGHGVGIPYVEGAVATLSAFRRDPDRCHVEPAGPGRSEWV